MYTTKAIIGIATVNTIVRWICWSRQAWSGIYLSLKATNTSESSAVHIFKTRTTVIAELVLLKTLFSCTGYVGVRHENGMARFCLGIAAYSIRPEVMNITKATNPDCHSRRDLTPGYSEYNSGVRRFGVAFVVQQIMFMFVGCSMTLVQRRVLLMAVWDGNVLQVGNILEEGCFVRI